MDHATVSIFLYNMDALCNMKGALCDFRVVLSDIKTVLCDMSVL